MPVPKPVELLGIDREYADSMLEQRLDNRAVRLFDRNCNPLRVTVRQR